MIYPIFLSSVVGQGTDCSGERLTHKQMQRTGSGAEPEEESHSYGRAEAPNVITVQLGGNTNCDLSPTLSSVRRPRGVVSCGERNKGVPGEGRRR